MTDLEEARKHADRTLNRALNPPGEQGDDAEVRVALAQLQEDRLNRLERAQQHDELMAMLGAIASHAGWPAAATRVHNRLEQQL